VWQRLEPVGQTAGGRAWVRPAARRLSDRFKSLPHVGRAGVA